MRKLLALPVRLVPFLVLSLAGCSRGGRGACNHLVYEQGGLTRAQYLPCAHEMLATMDALDETLEPLLKGDQRALLRARGLYARLDDQIRGAGGRNLTEGWEDASLNRLNIKLWNAYTSYQGVMALPNRQDAESARGSKEEARGIYEELR